MAAASDRAEVDTARPFQSVKEAVAVFGDRILVGGNSHSRHSTSAAAIAIATPCAAKHEASSSSSTMTFSPTPMAAEIEQAPEIMPATVPMYSAPSSSSPASLAASSQASPVVKPRSDRGGGDDCGGGVVTVRASIQKLEAEVAETRQEVARLRKRGSEMEMALASLGAQLHRGLSKLAEMEAGKTAAAAARGRHSIGGDSDTDVASSTTLRWGDRRLAANEYLPSFSHALSLGEMDDGGEVMAGGRRRKARKVKPVVPLIGDILFSRSRRKSAKEKGDDGFYSGDLYGVLG